VANAACCRLPSARPTSTTICSTWTTRTKPAIRASSRSAREKAGPFSRVHGNSYSWTSRIRITTAASCNSARMGCSTSAWATAGPRAIRGPCAEPPRAAGQAAPDRSVETRRALADHRLRPAQSLALLVRSSNRRSVHSRCRPASMGGDRLPRTQPTRHTRELRLARLRGTGAVTPPALRQLPATWSLRSACTRTRRAAR